MEKIYLAGGCFWGVERYFQNVQGVTNTVVGYGNCKSDTVDYKLVCTGQTGCAETVEITYDEKIVTSLELVQYLFTIINPTTSDRQGPDKGTQYRPGVYFKEEVNGYHEYIESIKGMFDKDIVVEYEPINNFIKAEDYHQNYLINNPGGYCHVNISKINNPKKFISEIQ